MNVKKVFSLFLIFILLLQIPVYANANTFKLPYECKAYILTDEATGKVLIEENADEKYAPASLTKIMLMDIVAELVEKNDLSLNDVIINTSQHAKDVEGSKLYLEVGKKLTLRDMLTAIALPSANDASIAVAEYFAGTEEEFVDLMNKKANRLGMTNTHFVNVCGLHDKNHYSSARDVAIVARDLLIKHPWIKKFTSTYSSKVEGKPLYNTNKMVRFYKGCTGLKTGSHDEAGFCLCACATRGSDENNDKMSLISVCLGVPTSLGRELGSKAREENCGYLLDYGFSSYKTLNAKINESELAPVEVLKGKQRFVSVGIDEAATPVLVKKSALPEIEKIIDINKKVEAPVIAGQILGSLNYFLDGEKIAQQNIVAKSKVGRANLWFLFFKITKNFFCGEEL